MKFFSSRSRPKTPRTAPGERIYAIGDVHGRYDLLQELLSKVTNHWDSNPKTARYVRVLFLGDIIDRGPDSAGCLRLVTKLTTFKGVACLRGNHEDLLLRSATGDPDAQHIWLENGGQATLESFGIAPLTQSEDSFDFGERIKSVIPKPQMQMLQATPTFLRSGDYFFVHAGVRPGVSLAKQSDYDLFFIREEFTASSEWHGAVVVHGHSIVEEVTILDNRIAIDTAAWRSGKLSCICLEGDQRVVLST